MSAETWATIIGIVLGVVVVAGVLAYMSRRHQAEANAAQEMDRRYARLARDRKCELLIDVITAPNTIARTPEALELVKSVVVVQKRAKRDNTEVFVTTPCGVVQEIYPTGHETGDQVYSRVLTAINYWATLMNESEMIGSVIRQQKIGDIL